VIVVAGGDAPPPALRGQLPEHEAVIAADSGADHALSLGLAVDLVIGDLDSVSAEGLEAARRAGADVQPHPAAKDHTDLELALMAAVDRGAERIVVVGGHGGRTDHFLANVLLLASPAFAGVDIESYLGPARVWAIRRPIVLPGRPGAVVSLLAAHGPARGIWTEGLAYPMQGEDLLPGSSRGVSNVFLEEKASVRLASGVLLAVVPT
jgi:thiamine pyrophosphokinase